ncbi:MAG: hypothetical protein RDU01_04115 [Thermodesulfovibrionales bacterium]|nr:hypothetical protein [Thermodesulfovibrionales bacterium]
MKCKQCNKEDIDKKYGLRDFHSLKCRKDYRRNYLRLKAQERRNNEKMKVSTDPSKIYKSQPTESTIYNRQNDESVNFFDSYGGKDWYTLAKRDCCNFDIRLKEGYCLTLAEPYQGFRFKCNNCSLGQALMNKVEGTRQKKAA